MGRMNNEVLRPKRKWLKRNYIGVSNEILETDWGKLFYGQDADFCYSLFPSSVWNPYLQGDINIFRKFKGVLQRFLLTLRIYHMRKDLRFGLSHH